MNERCHLIFVIVCVGGGGGGSDDAFFFMFLSLSLLQYRTTIPTQARTLATATHDNITKSVESHVCVYACMHATTLA